MEVMYLSQLTSLISHSINRLASLLNSAVQLAAKLRIVAKGKD